VSNVGILDCHGHLRKSVNGIPSEWGKINISSNWATTPWLTIFQDWNKKHKCLASASRPTFQGFRDHVIWLGYNDFTATSRHEFCLVLKGGET
jgi:hypothetical protein